MNSFIPCLWWKLKVFCLVLLFSCEGGKTLSLSGQLGLPSGRSVKIRLAVSQKDQRKGLSGLSPSQFTKEEGLFFFYEEDAFRSFWMPDTYFDLDMFFLDKNLKVLEILRKVPFHPGWKTPPPIYKTKPVFSRYILEMRSDSPLAKEIQKGASLTWIHQIKLSEIGSKIRLSR